MTDTPTIISADELDLVRKTIAPDATPEELKLFLYDCQRQGVHPLDKLIHFTKRSGKYTPVTSIDFMRIRAAETGEYAGNDDALFGDLLEGKYPEWARVSVWRLTQGQRCAFTATARWVEYKPDQHAFKWLQMPHTMLAKCAEALALRKGFPRQLAGLYAREEMDQAGPLDRPAAQGLPASVPQKGDLERETAGSGVRADPADPPIFNNQASLEKLPTGACFVHQYEVDQYGWHRAYLEPGGREVKTKYATQGKLLKEAAERHLPARVTYDEEKSYVRRVELCEPDGPF